jgi:RND family efflux transporter MFP subunit
MSGADPHRAPMMARLAGLACLALALTAAGCREASKPAEPPPPPRPVRTVTVEPAATGLRMTFTGRIEAQDQPSLGFRIAGRVAERPAGIGTRVQPGDVIARLDPENEMNALHAAEAALEAARSAARQAQGHLERRRRLLATGATTQAEFDDAEQLDRNARAREDAAKAQVLTARNILDFTVLRADAPGIVTATGAEPGEVVTAGRMIVRLDRQGGRDGVFDVPGEILNVTPENLSIAVSLPGSPATSVPGRLREVSPQADPTTRTFRVRVGLIDPPAGFRLGAAANATFSTHAEGALAVPASALAREGGQASVFVVVPDTLTLARRPVEIARLDPASVVISRGIAPGDVVVTAGVSQLREGQKVRLTGDTP